MSTFCLCAGASSLSWCPSWLALSRLRGALLYLSRKSVSCLALNKDVQTLIADLFCSPLVAFDVCKKCKSLRACHLA